MQLNTVSNWHLETKMGTYTTNYNLFMPTVGETGWGDLVNGNFSTIDSTMKSLSNRITAVENEVNGALKCTSVTTSGTITSTGNITGNGGITGTTGTFSGEVTASKFNGLTDGYTIYLTTARYYPSIWGGNNTQMPIAIGSVDMGGYGYGTVNWTGYINTSIHGDSLYKITKVVDSSGQGGLRIEISSGLKVTCGSYSYSSTTTINATVMNYLLTHPCTITGTSSVSYAGVSLCCEYDTSTPVYGFIY